MESLDEMLRGFANLEDYLRTQQLGVRQRVTLRAYQGAVHTWRAWLRVSGNLARLEKTLADAEARRVGLKLRARPSLKARPAGGHYLGASEVAEFERDGLLGPFPVLSPTEARELATDIRGREKDFRANCYLGQRVVAIQRRHGLWKLDWSGVYQALRHQGLWDLTTAPAIAHRLVSLMGEDLMSWRTQLFEKEPGAVGTFWHQNSVFQESSRARKLRPTTSVEPGMIQLTAWVALSDVTIANGALRIVPGSFADGRLEHAYEFANNHKLDFMAMMDPDRVEDFLRIGLFSPGQFMKVQAMFDVTVSRLSDMLEGRKVRDLEMRAGEAILFSSLNMHASFANTTRDDTRLAFAGRYANHDVLVYPGQTHDVFPTSEGAIPFPVAPLACIHVHGEDRFHHNHVVTACGDPSAAPERAAA